jgi:integrase
LPKVAKELSGQTVRGLKAPGFYSVGGVPGLALRISKSGAKYWVLRLVQDGKRQDLGVGAFPAMSLSEARSRARDIRVYGSPSVSEQGQGTAKQPTNKSPTFERAASIFIETYRYSWRNKKHAQQWENTLKTYAYPKIGDMTVDQVLTCHVLEVLKPIWQTKTETAARLRGRLEQILDWAHAHGYRSSENPAKWRGLLDKLLPNPNKISPHKHHRALPIDAMPEFYARLRTQVGVSAQALEFLILTAARTGEVRGCLWEEIDLKGNIWVVPGHRMKSGRTHRVPLSEQAVELLTSLSPKANGLVFQSPRGQALSDAALLALMRRMGVDAVPHGFRSSFRTWAAEVARCPREVAETALAHVIENKTEAAYQRGDLLEIRRELMEAWQNFLTVKN